MKRSLIHLCVFLFFVGSFTFAQTFQVTGRTTPGSTGSLALDDTIRVDFQVQGNGTTGLQFVPELVVSPSVPAALAAGINTTWSGTSPITGWTSGTTRTVSFFIHLYNLPSACGNIIRFNLFFTSASGTFQASGGSNLDFSSSSGDVVNLEFVASDLVAPPPFPHGA